MDIPVRLSIVIATEGKRPDTLRRMIRSIDRQIRPDDEVLIVGAVPRRIGIELLSGTKNFTSDQIFVIPCDAGHNWGHTERNLGMALTLGAHLVFGDDDDVFTPNAFDSIRSMASKFPDSPLMFRMIDRNGAVLWSRREVRMGNHGTPQFVVPNEYHRLGQFGDRYEGDYDFVVSTLAKYPGGERDIIWCDDVIYRCRNFGGDYL